MANAAEKLFDQVISQLPADDANAFPADWPKAEDEDDFDPLDRPPESSNEEILPYDHVQVADQVFDRMTNGQTVLEPSSEDKGLIEGGIRARGLEALAFYKSRRLIASSPFPGKWGIFYLKQGLTHIGWEISLAHPGYRDPRVLAHDFLFAHEHFHFRADMQTLMFEASLNKHLYLPIRRALKGRRTHFVEESLANRQAYDWAKKGQVGLREYAFDFMSLQPNAYARFDEPLADLAGEWAANVVNLQPPGCRPRYDLAPWVDATPKDLLRKSLCPEYVIFPTRLEAWLSPAWVPPPVTQIIDDTKVKELLESKFSQLATKWEATKQKLLQNRTLRGLNFKQWPKEGKGVYSVKIDDGFRAHLRHQGQGCWLAFKLGPHTQMGHG
jgi:hypothetical protein